MILIDDLNHDLNRFKSVDLNHLHPGLTPCHQKVIKSDKKSIELIYGKMHFSEQIYVGWME